MAEIVYALCAGTGILCAGMLLDGYRRGRTPLLFWSSVCFIGLALNDVLTLVDLVFVPEVDLATIRAAVALASTVVLVYGLAWQGE